jgi:hypothetical protein
MGPKLKLIIESEEVRLLYSEKERVGSPPRLAEQFVSRLESLKRKGLFLHLDLSSKKPALLKSVQLRLRGYPHCHYLTLTQFSSAFSQQLVKSV